MPFRTILSGAAPAAQFANGTRIRTSGLNGSLSQWVEAPGAFRSMRLPAEEDISPGFHAALENLEIYEQETIYFDVARAAAGNNLRTAAQADLVVLEPAPPTGPGETVPVILYQDESGGLTWHFPDGFDPAGATPTAALRASTQPRFTIPVRTLAAQAAMGVNRAPTHLRGPITKIGRKIFKVLLVPILAPLLANPVREIAGKMERKHRQNLIRAVTPDNFNRLVSTPFTDWGELNGKRALLIVHGIFSSAHGMLAEYPRAEMQKLHDGYGRRVIAMDQFTVTMSPEDNARFFLETARDALPGGRFDFDILCHSRGGVVSRTLVERGETLVPAHNCRFGKVYFVAAPNAGSPLGDAAHMVDMLDVFTNLATKFPDGPVTYGIEVLLALVKLTAYTAITRLPGIAAMGTTGYIPDILNAGKAAASARYAASAANYEPTAARDNGFFLDQVGDRAMDRIFEHDGTAVANDLVVPADGVWAANGHPSFPIADRTVYSAADGVYHTKFFTEPRTQAHITEFLGVGGPGAAADLAADDFAAPPAAAPAAAPLSAPAAAPLDDGFLLGRNAGEPIPLPRAKRFRLPKLPMVRKQISSVPGDDPGEPDMILGAPGDGAPPDEASPGGPKLEPMVVHREPHIAFHEATQEGVESPLTVSLDDLTIAGVVDFRQILEIGIAVGVDTVLDVLLLAPGFDVVPPASCRMLVGRQRNPATETLVYRLTPRHPGPEPATREIRAEFWLNNSCVGSVLHRTVVHPKGYQGPWRSDGSKSFQPVDVPAVRREDCDLLLVVEGEDESGQPPFRLRLQCAVPGHEYTAKYVGKLTGDQAGKPLGDYIRQIVDEEFARMPDPRLLPGADYAAAVKQWEADFKQTLDKLGARLWDWLPEQLRTEYFRLRDARVPVRSILVHSDEMVIPWELIVPHRMVGGQPEKLPPLGQAHILGRWKPGLTMRPQPQRFNIRNFSILNPAYPPGDELPGAAQEAVELLRLFPRASRLTPTDGSSVQKLLEERSDIQLLHFSCHGDYHTVNADLSGLLLENGGRLRALDLNNALLLAKGTPFVYLNACSVGTTGGVAGRLGGFAAVLLESGCSGVIAPYWPVDDVSAKEFSLSLYAKLMTGRAVGEALQELRAERPDDVTFRAFALYGDPWTRLNLRPVM